MIYSRQSTAIHAARPGATVFWASALTLAVVACPHPAALAVLAVGVPLLATAARVPRPVLLASALAIPFGLLWIVTNALLVRDGLTVILRLGELPPLGQVDVTLEAVVQGGILALRGIVALQIGLLLSACVDPDRFLVAVRRIAPRAGLTGAIALRLAPALVADGRRYADGLRCRADGGALGSRERLLVLSATVGRAIDRADSVAAMLELRGMRSAGRVTVARRVPWSRHDVSVVASGLAVLALTLAATSMGTLDFEVYPQLDGGPALPAALWSVSILLLAALPLASTRGTEPRR